jgi:hypothetical protein
MLLSKFRQPIRGGPEIVTQHRTSGDNLVLDCLLDQLVLTDAQPRGNFGGQRTHLSLRQRSGNTARGAMPPE